MKILLSIVILFVVVSVGHYYVNRKTNSDVPVEATVLANGGATVNSGAWEQFEKPTEAVLREQLTPMQFNVTQADGTEPPYQNLYFETKEEGIYVDIVSGEPLFSSTDKYDSGTGWPSFTKPIYAGAITEKIDYKLVYPRTEIRSRYADSHLGHLFNDGPKETGGLRYCMNSAALRFVSKENLAAEGYQAFLSLFE